jgi:hypothetical protein
MEKFQAKPERLPYGNNRIKYRHYGKMVEKLIEEIRERQDPDQKRALIVLTANHMKKSFLTWNKDSVEDEQIYNDINTLYGGPLILPEGMTLSNSKELLQKKMKPIPNKPQNNNNNNNNGNKKKNNNRTFHKKQNNNNNNSAS